ncbi:MAG TPA: thiamine-binding protein [Saprospiraceae bacterium]|nr:thiamine-binding protein [Saprospiraceae bacterium]
MNISIEVSMYPLDTNYLVPIQDYIDRLNQFEDIRVRTNSMSTQIFGPYDTVMKAVSVANKHTFLEEEKVVFVMKMINSDLDYTYEKPSD